jgi:DNA-binding NarL/FixJ family response regulator
VRLALPEMEPPTAQPIFTLLLASTRWAVHSFFDGLRARGLPTLVVVPIDTVDISDLLEEATVAVVDVAPDVTAALSLCRDLRRRRPSLPIVALLCCPGAVSPRQLHELLREGTSLLDLQASAHEAVRALRDIAGGSSVLHLHLHRGQRELVRDVLAGRAATAQTRVAVLELVARGFRDHEIGAKLHLSPHTVKHHVDALRAEIGARNRIELAAWAGRNGFYSADGATEPTVPVQLAPVPKA